VTAPIAIDAESDEYSWPDLDDVPKPRESEVRANAAGGYVRAGLALAAVKSNSEDVHTPKNHEGPFTYAPDAERYFGFMSFRIGVDLGASKVLSLRVYDLDGARVALASVGVDLNALIAAGAQLSCWRSGWSTTLFRLPATSTMADNLRITWPAANGHPALTLFEIRADGVEVLPPSAMPTGERRQWLACDPRAGDLPLLPEPVAVRLADLPRLKWKLLRACPYRPADLFDTSSSTTAAAMTGTPDAVARLAATAPADNSAASDAARTTKRATRRAQPAAPDFDRIDLDAVNALGVSVLAQAAGLRIERSGIRPCPACGTEKRGSTDKRAPVGMRSDGKGAMCQSCKRTFSPVTLFAAACGQPTLNRTFFEQLRASGLVGGAANAHRAVCTIMATEDHFLDDTPRRPPLDEVEDLWARSTALADDRAVSERLRRRALSARELDALGQGRVLPRRGSLPSWARSVGRSWRRHHRVVVPLFDELGVMRSLHARALNRGLAKTIRKGLMPGGFAVRGLVMACPTALNMLRAGEPPGVLVIAEGVTDFFSWIQDLHHRGRTAAVMGVVSGAFTETIAARIPNGTRVVIGTDHDDAGNEMATKIAAHISKAKGNDASVQRTRKPQERST